MSSLPCIRCHLRQALLLRNISGCSMKLLPTIQRGRLQNYSKVASDSTIVESQPQPLIAKGSNDLSFITLRAHLPSVLEQVQNEEIDFSKTDTGQVIVYTDGSCLFNNTMNTEARKSGIGVFWGRENHPLNVALPHGGSNLTSNRAEIAAAHTAIILAKRLKIERLRLYTDSKHLVNACKYWLPVWQHNGWKLKSGIRPVMNKDMWKKLSEDLLYVLVDFKHSTDKNEGIKKAHKLAQIGSNSVQN